MKLFEFYSKIFSFKELYHNSVRNKIDVHNNALKALQLFSEFDEIFKSNVSESDQYSNRHKVMSNFYPSTFDFITAITNLISVLQEYEIPEELFEKYSRFPDWYVRRKLIFNKFISKEMLTLLTKDCDIDVRSDANYALERLVSN